LTTERRFPSTDVPDDDADLGVHVPNVKDVLQTLSNAVSAMKIYPSDHDTVKAFVDALTAKFERLLQDLPRLEIEVGEHAFVFADRVVYADESTIKSLPFFFYKDGMEILSFSRGLDHREIVDFLELIKTVGQGPGEDNDIVSALWESDFPNIQYYAPDDFLENRIQAERRESQDKENLPDLPSDLAHETFETRVDREKLAKGQIVINPVDRDRLGRGPGGENAEAATPVDRAESVVAAPEASAGIEPALSAAGVDLSEAELQEIDDLVRDNRLLWPEEDFINLTVEIIFLEEDLSICASSLDLLGEFLVDQVRAGQFPVANSLLAELRELRFHLGEDAADKAALIDAALRKMTGPRTLAALDAALGANPPESWPALLALLRRLGLMALPTAAGLYEKWDDTDVRAQFLDFIKDAGSPDPGLIARLASDVRPALSAAAVGLLADMPEGKGVPSLAAFAAFKNRNIRLEAIQALGRLRNPEADQVLLCFLDDADEHLRIEAARLLGPVGETPSILGVIDRASASEFAKRSFNEKQAILSFLGRTRSAEALRFLTTVLDRTTFWPSRKSREMRLAAVAGLASIGTAESAAALEKGATGRDRRVREACAEALALSGPTASAGSEGEHHGRT
jgi:HEAT repeat protein